MDDDDKFFETDDGAASQPHEQQNDDALDKFIEEGDRVDPVPASQETKPEGEDQKGEGDQQGQQDAGKGAKGDQQGQQQQQPEGQRTAGPQDLTLPDGTVIKGGPERRLYEKSQRLESQLGQTRQEYDRVNNELSQARAQVQAYEQAFSSAQELGISPQEANIGHRIVASYKKDPVGTINYLLTEAKSAGHDVTQVGGAGVDQAAIQRAIEQQLKPITERYRAEEQEQQRTQEAEREAQQFFQRFPDAQPHEAELSRLLDGDPSLSPDAAYYALREYYARNGLNFRYPLSAYREQGAQNGNGQQQPQTQQTQQPRQQSIPNGRGGAATASPHTAYDPNKSASENADWGDIITSAMRDAGL